MLRGLGDLSPPTHGRAIGVGETRVFSVGKELLHRFGVPFHEFVQRQLILLDQLIDILYGRHLEFTSTVDASFLPLALCDHPTLFTEVPGRGILRTSLPPSSEKFGARNSYKNWRCDRSRSRWDRQGRQGRARSPARGSPSRGRGGSLRGTRPGQGWGRSLLPSGGPPGRGRAHPPRRRTPPRAPRSPRAPPRWPSGGGRRPAGGA